MCICVCVCVLFCQCLLACYTTTASLLDFIVFRFCWITSLLLGITIFCLFVFSLFSWCVKCRVEMFGVTGVTGVSVCHRHSCNCLGAGNFFVLLFFAPMTISNDGFDLIMFLLQCARAYLFFFFLSPPPNKIHLNHVHFAIWNLAIFGSSEFAAQNLM